MTAHPTEGNAVLRRRIVWLAAVPVAAVALLSGGAWFYTHVVEGDAPGRLSLGADASSPSAGLGTTATGGSVDGTWTLSTTSQVGYRVHEVLFGQSSTAVGRTSKVTGSLAVSGTRVTAATFTVDMVSVSSDQSRRDGQFRGRIMDVATYPTSAFALTQPIDLKSVPADGVTVTATATGTLTLHGQAKAVTFPVKARRNGATIEVNGTIPVVFADYGIDNPSFGPAQTEDHGELEFLLVFTR